ncbi:hypothetical protein [Rhizobium sp. CFBP 13644]|uniref:hypothetical protein n=1 Tax=unclassified Rhizobium TaxID=2613769 RepID=UPI00406D4242
MSGSPAIARGLLVSAELKLKEHDRLALARTIMKRKLIGKRTSSKLPELIELVVTKPLVSDDHQGDRRHAAGGAADH